MVLLRRPNDRGGGERRNAEVIILGATRSNGSRRRNSVDPLTQEVAARARQRVMFIHEKEAA